MPAAATLYVRDIDAMAAFYRGCFGLAVVADAPGDYRIVESDAWTVSIVQVPEAIAATISVSVPPARRHAAPVKLCFEVRSLDELRTLVADLGGRMDDETWEFRGFWHCDCVDPEGNVVLLRQPAGAAP